MFATAFRDGGWGMFPTLVFGLGLLWVALKYARTPEKRLVPLLFGLGIVTLSSGALGFVTGLMVTLHYAALAGGAPGIAMMGVAESLNNVAFAMAFVVVASMASSYGAYKSSRASFA